MPTQVNIFHLFISKQQLDFINAVAVTSDSRYIISGSFDQSIKVFDLHAKQESYSFHNAHQG